MASDRRQVTADQQQTAPAARSGDAVAGLFNAPLGAAGIIALKAWCIPPAQPVVLISLSGEQFGEREGKERLIQNH